MPDSSRPRDVHAGLFEAVFRNPEHAASELRLVLPPSLVERIDWSTLELCPSKYRDSDLTSSEVDLLFRVLLDGRPAFIYILFEHQSTSDHFMAFRILRYEVRIWDAFLRNNPEAKLLPPIVPVVLHHSNAGWSAPTVFTELLELGPSFATLAPFVPQFRLLLDDISAATDEELRRRSFVATVALGLLRDSRRSTDLLADLRRWFTTLRAIANAPGGVAALTILLNYAHEVGDIPFRPLQKFAHQVGPAAVEALMTTAERLRQQGREEAMTHAEQIAQKARAEALAEAMTHAEQIAEKARAEAMTEGEARGKAALVTRQLALRFGPLPAEVAARVQSAPPDQLETWAERLLTARRLEDVFE